MRCLMLFTAVSLVAACSDEKAPMITVTDASVRATGDSATAYATLISSGGDDRLVAVDAGALGPASLHETTMDGGIMRMRATEGIAVPAGARVALKSAGAHVMITPLARPLANGERVPLSFRFRKQGAVRVEAAVTILGAAAHNGMDHR